MCSCVFKSCAIVSRAHASSCFGFHGVMCSCHVGSHNVSCMCSRHECSLISCVHDIAGSRARTFYIHFHVVLMSNQCPRHPHMFVNHVARD